MSIVKKRNGHYTKAYLDQVALGAITRGKNIEWEYEGKKYILDIKEYEANLRFTRPDLFKDEKDKNI